MAGLGFLVACSGDAPVDAGGVPVTVLESGEVACPNPVSRGLQGPFERKQIEVPLPEVHWTWAGGITAADLDEDGYLDVLVPVEPGMGLYRGGPDGTFTEIGKQVFAGRFDLSYASGTSVADYDGDGDLDIYVMRITGEPAPEGVDGANKLLRNDGNLLFTDVTAEAGVHACGAHHRDPTDVRCFRTMTSSWGDVDLDGDLDLYVGNYGFVDETPGTTQEQMQPAEPDFLYRNEGNGTFTDISGTLPVEVHDGYTYAGGLFDLDGDDDLDLYTVNDFGNCWPNRVMWNEGGALVWNGAPSTSRCPGTTGGDPRGLEKSMTGMGLGIGDLNADGLMDLAIPVWAATGDGGMVLLESERELGIWFDVANATGFTASSERDQRVGWGTELGDLDNDGDLDIVSQYGHLENDNPVWENPTTQHDALYLNVGDGEALAFVDVAPEWGIHDPWQTRGTVLADFDRDGWLDVAKRSLTGDNALYLSHCGGEAWLEVKLEQPGTMNRDAVGARIVVVADGRTHVRWIVAGGTGYASSPPPEAHFGLGAADAADWVFVVWPDGERSAITGLSTRQRVTITREEG